MSSNFDPSAADDAQHLICRQFENMLDTCFAGWSSGKHTVVLPGHLQDLLGDLGLHYFHRTLTERVGGRVSFTFVKSDNGFSTHVRMPATLMHQLTLPTAFVPNLDVSELVTTDTNVADTGAKKPPRPMNCWIIFREAMSKLYKTINPDMSVQEISSKCSETWGNLTPELKEPWRKAADLAKEEHRRQHPDYKYTPRKPGQKKKRQSRKAKLAAMDAAETTVFHLEVVPDSAMDSFNTHVTPTIATGSVAVNAGHSGDDEAQVDTDDTVNDDTTISTNNIDNDVTEVDTDIIDNEDAEINTDNIDNDGTQVNNINNINNNVASVNVGVIAPNGATVNDGYIVNNVNAANVGYIFNAPTDAGHFVNNAIPPAQVLYPTPQLPMTYSYLHSAETVRQARLQAEFGVDAGTNIMFEDLFGDDAFAFRDGADSDATLPSFYPDLF